MGKTADLTVVQKIIIDTLHKEGKTQTFITKEAVHRVLYPSMLTESWVEGKRCTTNRENRSLMRIVKHPIQEFGWTSQGMDWGWGQGIKSTTHRRVEEFGYSCHQRRLTWAKRRRTGLLPSGPKSSFQMRASFVFHLETKVLESGGRVEKLIAQVAWSPVLSFHSLWWFGCNVICWCWSIVFFENQHHCTRLPRNASCFLHTQVSQFELNYWNKWTFPRHSNLLRCTCTLTFGLIKREYSNMCLFK